MRKNIRTKRIKITSRGMATTSRGRFRTPLGPYEEDVKMISIMIVRDHADVVEILPDGTEVPLTIQNFDKDNSNSDTPVPTPVVKKESKVENTPKVEVTETPAQEEQVSRPLTRKEKRKLDREKQNSNKPSSENKEDDKKETAPETPVEESTEIPTDAIEQ